MDCLDRLMRNSKGADLGDPRLEARLLTLVAALGEAPTASLARGPPNRWRRGKRLTAS